MSFFFGVFYLSQLNPECPKSVVELLFRILHINVTLKTNYIQ